MGLAPVVVFLILVYVVGIFLSVLVCLKFFRDIEEEDERVYGGVPALEPVDIPSPKLSILKIVVLSLLWPLALVCTFVLLFFAMMCEFFGSV